MQTKVRTNFHSISIKITDEKKVSATIKLVYGGFTLSGSAPASSHVDLNGIINPIGTEVQKYLGVRPMNLCGCENLGEFSNLLAARIEQAKTWADVPSKIAGMCK